MCISVTCIPVQSQYSPLHAELRPLQRTVTACPFHRCGTRAARTRHTPLPPPPGHRQAVLGRLEKGSVMPGFDLQPRENYRENYRRDGPCPHGGLQEMSLTQPVAEPQGWQPAPTAYSVSPGVTWLGKFPILRNARKGTSLSQPSQWIKGPISPFPGGASVFSPCDARKGVGPGRILQTPTSAWRFPVHRSISSAGLSEWQLRTATRQHAAGGPKQSSATPRLLGAKLGQPTAPRDWHDGAGTTTHDLGWFAERVSPRKRC